MIDPGTGYSFVEKSIEIMREELENFQGTDPFTCECRAYYKGDSGESDWQHVATEKTIVQIACECVLLYVLSCAIACENIVASSIWPIVYYFYRADIP